MTRLGKQSLAKALSLGIMLMGTIHIIATFTPLIADRLTLLPNEARNAFTYFSLMCGALLILGGGIVYMLSGRVAGHPFARKPYTLALVILTADGVLAVWHMPHNPFAWIIFSLTMCLLLLQQVKDRRGSA